VQTGLMLTPGMKKKSEIDMFYPVVNYIGVVLDNIYLSVDAYYPKSNKLV